MTHTRRAVVLGGRTGLLGMSLTAALQRRGYDAAPQGREDVNPLDPSALRAYLAEQRPDVVFNAIAYTAVDRAEDEPEAAYALNKTLPVCLGRASAEIGFRLFHFSTDFVFSGKAHAPYGTDATPKPASVYGASKLAGETGLLALGLDTLTIARTAWLFGPGKGNFVRTILGLAKERESLGVVHDQIGSPTYTPDLAEYAVALADTGCAGLFHIVNGGEASWCELAAEAVNIAGLHCKVHPIPSSEYPQQAKRPAYSVLSTASFTQATGITPRPWAQALRDYVFQEMAAERAS